MGEIEEYQRSFEESKQVDENGIEFWSARDLMPLLGYTTWENFTEAIARAKTSLRTNGVDPIVVFRETTKNYKSSNRHGEFEAEKPDFHVYRFGVYLVAQNGDPKKPQIAAAQSYFTIQTIRQEDYDKLPDDEKRLYVRSQVVESNKQLNSSAKQHGVTNFAYFHNSGYLGLYGLNLSQIITKKRIGKDKLMDRAGSTELAANLFRITQTDERLKKDLGAGKQHGQSGAESIHRTIGARVRQAIKDTSGVMPENLPAEPHIKELGKKIDTNISASRRPKRI